MMQNLNFYCRKIIEALEDKQCQFGYIYRVTFENFLVQSANKISYY